MINSYDGIWRSQDADETPARLVNLNWREKPVEDINRPRPRPCRHGVRHFFAELRRRRVCRAAALYAVVTWLLSQIVGLYYIELGLPDWTLKFVLVVSLLGFPIALILSWLFDITPDSQRRRGVSAQTAPPAAGRRSVVEKSLDCCLIISAAAISLFLAVGLPGGSTSATEIEATPIAVLPFSGAMGDEAAALSQGLMIELQHELRKQNGLVVIVPSASARTPNSFSLTGMVALSDSVVRVVAMIVDNDTGTVVWSRVYHRKRADSLMIPVQFAREIVATAPPRFRNAISSEASRES